MLNTNKTLRRAVSIGAMACGIVPIILCLVLAFTGSTLSFRGPLLVIGAAAFFLGLYLYPTVFHHRTIVNVIFLFPLLFTFVVTVILPFALGIFYSLTGGTPARMMGSTIYSNGTEMLALNIYKTAVSKSDYATAQAKAVLFFIMLAAVSLIQVRISNKREVEM